MTYVLFMKILPHTILTDYKEMKMKNSFFKTEIRKIEDLDIFYYENIEESDSLIVFIVHGLAEHAQRYIKLGENLREKGIGCAALDLPGHGKTAGGLEGRGKWPDDGFNFCIETVSSGINILKEKYGKSIVLMGHSLGSIISFGYIQKYGNALKGCILSGANDEQNAALISAGKFVASIQCAIKGNDFPTKLLDKMSFGSFNGHFKPNRTNFDWLSRDEKEVDKYVEDPYCGFISTAGLFKSFINGLSSIYKDDLIAAIPDDLQIYIFAGGKDPVGNFGKGSEGLSNRLRNAGKKNINFKIYDEARHECLNETNSDEVIEDIVKYCEEL